jgi:hypothetical protein
VRLKLPSGETDPGKRYSMPDPDALADAYSALYRARWYGERDATPEEVSQVLMLAQAYLHLTTYELGQECCVRKLRDIWRARRAEPEESDDE